MSIKIRIVVTLAGRLGRSSTGKGLEGAFKWSGNNLGRGYKGLTSVKCMKLGT